MISYKMVLLAARFLGRSLLTRLFGTNKIYRRNRLPCVIFLRLNNTNRGLL